MCVLWIVCYCKNVIQVDSLTLFFPTNFEVYKKNIFYDSAEMENLL